MPKLEREKALQHLSWKEKEAIKSKLKGKRGYGTKVGMRKRTKVGKLEGERAVTFWASSILEQEN